MLFDAIDGSKISVSDKNISCYTIVDVGVHHSIWPLCGGMTG